MKSNHPPAKPGGFLYLAKKLNTKARIAVAAIVLATTASLQVVEAQGLPVIFGHHYRPHYWDLPTEFSEGFWFPGQTLSYNSTDKKYDAHGNKVSLGGTHDFVFGFTILPYLFKFNPSDAWAYAFSLNTYEYKDRFDGTPGLSGVGNLIPAFTGWTKPTKASTVGYDILLGLPIVASKDMDQRKTDIYLRGFYDTNINNVNFEGVTGYHHAFKGRGETVGYKDDYHVNFRLGYDIVGVTGRDLTVTPYVALDRQWNQGNTQSLTNAGLGVRVGHKNFMNWTVSYTKSLNGRDMIEANMLQSQIWWPI